MRKIRTFLASDYMTLDSDVHKGGGTDNTEALQKILDLAVEEGGVRLVMDGAALVTHLRLHDNTTIECLTRDCGFYQKDGSDDSIVTNWDINKTEISNRNITLKGGTYNQNCANQVHHRAFLPGEVHMESEDAKYIFAIEFYGVENLVIEDLNVRDFRTFAVTVGCFKNCRIENVWLELPGRMHANNQDGFHFWGPGQFLTVRNVGGRVGDDFMNIGPDEQDGVSSITDVIVDGVMLDDADQAIRVLSRGTGVIDRLTVRNVIGTYRSFGFYINSWFPDKTCGQFGDMLFENIDLKQTAPNYDYRDPMLFSVGGEIRSLVCKNIRHIDPCDKRALFELGLPFYATTPKSIDAYEYPGNYPHIDYLEIDGLTILEKDDSADGAEYIQNFGLVDTMVLRHVTAVRRSGTGRKNVLLSLKKRAEIRTLIMDSVHTEGFREVIDGPSEQIGSLISDNCTAK
ncbi:MAG: hypothetical protein J6023_00780 [Clostridia bacterium]|nr:hypothetical protein [Clostridia bacterium]